MSNPLARLLGSLANVVLDLGISTIRGWLQGRLGPDADVAAVSTDGSIVRLRGVRIPLGPRGLVILDEAAATITSLGDAGPALRLCAFEGVLVFTRSDLRDRFARTDDANAYVANATFRADVTFTAAEDPDPSAWIAGDLAIRRAIWTTSADVPALPLEGAARLFVSSREWRLEGGRLDGGPTKVGDGKPPVVARFGAAGVLERDDGDARDATLLVPRTLSTLTFTLAHGRVGPFLDALTALGGEEAVRARVPAAIPRDTRIDGELSWSATAGARAELRLDAATLRARATVRAGCAPTGDDLTGRVDGSVALAALLRRFDVSTAAVPRDDDLVAIDADLGGHVRAPTVRVGLRAGEIGFRLGRPRFVPAVVLREITGTARVADGRVTGRLDAAGQGRAITAEVEARLGDLAAARATIRADALDALLLRDVARTLGGDVAIADETAASVAIVIEGRRVSGDVALTAAGSRLVAELGAPDVLARVTGVVRAEDAVGTGLFGRASVWPSGGRVAVTLDVTPDLVARGALAAEGALTLSVRRGDGSVIGYDVAGATASVSLDRAGLRYDDLRFSGYGGRFRGGGAVPFGQPPPPAPPYLVLRLEDGGSALAAALLRLAHPAPAIDVPPSLSGRGTLVLAADLGLAIDVALATPNGTELTAALRIARGSLDGSTASGALAVEDAVALARADAPLRGVARVDVEVVETDERTYRAFVSCPSLAGAPVVLEELSAAVVVTARGDVMWNRAGARLAGGLLASFGVARRGGAVSARVSAASVAVHELPPIESRTLGAYVRGRASGTLLGHRTQDGAIEASGDVVLDEASFPVLARARPVLARYGLRPPNEDAAGPAVATMTLDARGVRVSDVSIDLHGAAVKANVDVSPTRSIDGAVEITLEEEYLRTSKVLTLPRVLGERLVIPVAVGGTVARPEVKAELGQTLGRFLRDNKVVDFVASAVEEAQLFFRKDSAPRSDPRPAGAAKAGESELRAAIESRSADWEAIARRRS